MNAINSPRSFRKSAQVTIDHARIRSWVEERGGSPATIKGTEGEGDVAGILRLNFPDYASKDRLKQISWEDFFKKFDQRGLAFLFQERTVSGELSRFWKFVKRHP